MKRHFTSSITAMGHHRHGLIILVVLLIVVGSCRQVRSERSRLAVPYERFRDSVVTTNKPAAADSSNIFDNNEPFIPQRDSVHKLLAKIDTILRYRSLAMQQADSLITRLRSMDSASKSEKEALAENRRMLDSFLSAGWRVDSIPCRETRCYLYLEIIKSKQRLYLYLDGELKDSFAVSTGVKGFTTPNMNRRPTGPIFTRYTSKKFPGGNYKGLGNMPYAVFVSGGYAIHGTTVGNIPLLGNVASHGCIRLHPDNARLIYELVKIIGLSDTWVQIRDDV